MDVTKRILVVDDKANVRQLLSEYLTGQGYQVETAVNGREALYAARHFTPDVILLDIMMPEMDGLEVFRQLQEDPRTRDIPVIFLTAKTGAEDVIAGLEVGAVDYVTKPTHPAILKARIRTHLRLSRQQQELREQRTQALDHARLREEIERMARHDIKNPLNALLALAHNLAASDNLLPSQRETVSAIEESAQHVLDMVNHSLALQRMEMGTYQLKPVALDILDLLGKVVAETRSAFGPLNIAMHPDTSDSLLIQGEALLCHAIFSNLLRNAAEAAPADSLIRFTLTRRAGRVIVRLHNEGAVPESVRDTFFDKYATAGKAHGTGLGTYSARLMTETQGGTISMETSERAGTTVTVSLPAMVRSGEGQDA